MPETKFHVFDPSADSETPPSQCFFKLEGDEHDNDTVDIQVVDRDGDQIVTLGYISASGLVLYGGCEDHGFATDKDGRIKVVKS